MSFYPQVHYVSLGGFPVIWTPHTGVSPGPPPIGPGHRQFVFSSSIPYTRWSNFTHTPTANYYTFTGPSSGLINVPSANFYVNILGSFIGTITITPSGGGLSTPIVLVFDASMPVGSFSITPNQTGVITLTSTNSAALIDPSPLLYTSFSATTGISVYPDPFSATSITSTVDPFAATSIISTVDPFAATSKLLGQ